MSIAAKYILAFFPILGALFYIVQRFYLRTSRQLRLLEIEYKAPLYSHIMETLSGLATIRAFGWENDHKKKNMHALENSQRPLYLLYCVQRVLPLTLDMITTLLAVVLVTLVTTIRQQIGPGNIGIALTNITTFSLAMKGLLMSWIALETSIAAVARVKSFVAEVEPKGSHTRVEPEKPWPQNGRIEYREVFASYPYVNFHYTVFRNTSG